MLAWGSVLEKKLLELYVIARGLLLPEQPRPHDELAIPDHPVADQVFEARQTLNLRMDLIEALPMANARAYWHEHGHFRDQAAVTCRPAGPKKKERGPSMDLDCPLALEVQFGRLPGLVCRPVAGTTAELAIAPGRHPWRERSCGIFGRRNPRWPQSSDGRAGQRQERV